jgi:hypothetical protein
MSLVLLGSTSGSVTLQEPAIAGSTVINLPSTIGNASTSAVVTTDASGNVGIGVTPSAWSGSVVLQMTGPSLWGSSGVSHLSTNTYYDGTNYKYIATNFVTDAYQLNGAHVWRSAASGTAGTNVTFSATTTLNANGVLALQGAVTNANGVGITFPTTAISHSSSNANTLDDYEEGTWTPAVRGSGTAGTYTPVTVEGTYTKVGRLVTASFRILGFSAASGGTGYMQITGVPFTNTGYACGSVRFQFLTVAGSAVMVDVEFISSSGATILNFFESYNNAAGQDTPISSVSTSTSLFGTITFSAA